MLLKNLPNNSVQNHHFKILRTQRYCVEIFLLFLPFFAFSNILNVGKNEQYKTIKSAISAAKTGDTVLVQKGFTKKEISVFQNL